jgi:hypothetical protein
MFRFCWLLRRAAVLAAVFAISTCSTCLAATLDPLASFGGTNFSGTLELGGGWRDPGVILPDDVAGVDGFSPGTYAYLGSNFLQDGGVGQANLERGIAYNPTTGNLILVSRSSAGNGIRILDGVTGADKGALNQGTGIITGGTFTTNMVGVADDGSIYVGNLTTNTSTTPFNVYRWDSESAVEPTVAFSGTPGGILAGARIGDTFDVIGSGTNTRLVAGYNRPPNVAGNNSFAMFDTTDGATFTATHIAVGTDPPAEGDFRLGITFADEDTVIGKQGEFARIVDVTGSTGTLAASFDTDGTTLRAMDYAIVDGRPLLAIVEASAAQDPIARARLFVYDMSDVSKPVAERKIGEVSALPAGLVQDPNVNGTGQVKFGPIDGRTAIIYALSSNNGIQAFELTLDPAAVDSGDFDGDGFVDGRDFLTWQTGFGINDGSAARTDGDANNDGNVDDLDLGIWETGLGTTPSGATVAGVPEPTSLVLTLVLASLPFRVRRHP